MKITVRKTKEVIGKIGQIKEGTWKKNIGGQNRKKEREEKKKKKKKKGNTNEDGPT